MLLASSSQYTELDIYQEMGGGITGINLQVQDRNRVVVMVCGYGSSTDKISITAAAKVSDIMVSYRRSCKKRL